MQHILRFCSCQRDVPPCVRCVSTLVAATRQPHPPNPLPTACLNGTPALENRLYTTQPSVSPSLAVPPTQLHTMTCDGQPIISAVTHWARDFMGGGGLCQKWMLLPLNSTLHTRDRGMHFKVQASLYQATALCQQCKV
jgi:hypothetical protein